MRSLHLTMLTILLLSGFALVEASQKKWGFYAHMQINRMAVFTLPPEMFGFYKRNIEYLTKHAVDPDKMRYLIKEEGARHFIDLDHYPEFLKSEKLMRWNEAVNCYSVDSLQAKGVLPWNIEQTFYKLTKAFAERDSAKILRYSAYLGHYIGDSSVPLHTTSNYNGQLTGQKGIHGFWETRLPVLFASNYDQLGGRAYYVKNPLAFIWKHILQSHAAVDSVLLLEAELTSSTSLQNKFGLVEKNRMMVSDYSEGFSQQYHQKLNGMVERRMLKAIELTGSFWYSAWVNAGKPQLTDWSNNENEQETMDTISSKRNFHVREEE